MGYEPVTVREAAEIEVLLFVGLAFVGGLLTIYWGFQTYQFGRLIRDTPPEQVQSVAMGRTEVTGEIVPATRVYDRPFTEGQCIYGEFKVREYKRTADDDDNNREWKTVQKDSFSAPFYIDDGTGQILVEADEEALYEISDTHSVEIEVSGSESPPDPVQEFLGQGTGSGGDTILGPDGGGIRERIGGVLGRFGLFGGDEESDELDTDDQGGDPDAVDIDERETESDGVERIRRHELGSTGRTGNRRRYIQSVLPANEKGYVFGGATRPDVDEEAPYDEDILMRSDPSTGEFIISDRDEFGLASTYRNRSVMYIVAAVVVTTFILALLVQVLVTGPLYGIEEALP
jgi:hypothetical protein